jgi:hypothetical protein
MRAAKYGGQGIEERIAVLAACGGDRADAAGRLGISLARLQQLVREARRLGLDVPAGRPGNRKKHGGGKPAGRFNTPLTRAELKRTGLVRLAVPRRCPGCGALCEIWPCITCEPGAAVKRS